MYITLYWAFFFWSLHDIWQFPSQGLNLHHSSNPSRCSNNTGSLTHCTTRELLYWVSYMFRACFAHHVPWFQHEVYSPFYLQFFWVRNKTLLILIRKLEWAPNRKFSFPRVAFSFLFPLISGTDSRPEEGRDWRRLGFRAAPLDWHRWRPSEYWNHLISPEGRLCLSGMFSFCFQLCPWTGARFIVILHIQECSYDSKE